MPPIFKNRPNPFVKLEDGSGTYLSRSTAAIMSLVHYSEHKEVRFAMCQRGPTTPDFQGMWCLPCGYLDWDECGWQCAVRETYEELSFYLEDHPFVKHRDIDPWKVNTHPSTNRQNVSHHYGAVIVGPQPVIHPFDYGECTATEWKSIEWIAANEHNIAFNHAATVQSYLAYLVKNGILP